MPYPASVRVPWVQPPGSAGVFYRKGWGSGPERPAARNELVGADAADTVGRKPCAPRHMLPFLPGRPWCFQYWALHAPQHSLALDQPQLSPLQPCQTLTVSRIGGGVASPFSSLMTTSTPCTT